MTRGVLVWALVCTWGCASNDGDALDAEAPESIEDGSACSGEPALECGVGDGDWNDECADGRVGSEPVARVCDEGRKACYRRLESHCAEGFCRIPAGSWRTGSAREPGLPIVLTRSFDIAMTEVTVGEWLMVMGGENPARNACGLDCPVVGVTLFDALHYANRRSEDEGLETCYRLGVCDEPSVGYGRVCDSATFEGPDCSGYRLPSEWEWELAANGGESACIWNEGVDPCFGCLHEDYTCTAYSAQFPDIQAWYCANATASYAGCTPRDDVCVGPHAVATLAPNGFGLYDMHGNVAELTGTAYVGQLDYPPAVPPPEGVQVDPGFDREIVVGFLERWDDLLIGQGVITRGGSFFGSVHGLCAWRPGTAYVGVEDPRALRHGFRLVRTRHEDAQAAPADTCVPDADAGDATADGHALRDSAPADTRPTQTEVHGEGTVHTAVPVEPVPLALPEPAERACPTWREVGPVATPWPRVVRASGDDDVWGLDGPSAWHWDGATITMTPTACGLDAPVGLWGEGGELWAATRGGSAWHRDHAGAWREHLLTQDEQLNAIAGVAADDIWVAGTRGFLAHWDGARWSAQRMSASNGEAPDMLGLWAGDGDEVWAVGTVDVGSQLSDGPGVVFRLRQGWERMLERRGLVESVWGWGRDDVIVGGGGPQHEGLAPRLQRFDGQVWTDVPAPWVARISRIGGPSADDLWVFGAHSTTWHLQEGLWMQLLSEGPSDPRPFRTDDMATTATSMWGFYGSALARFSGTRAEPLWEACCHVIDIGGRGPDDVWLVGERGLVMHWDGARYTLERDIERALPDTYGHPSFQLRAVWAAPDGIVWAVGSGGAVWRRDGDARWSKLDGPSSSPNLTGVWGVGDEVWITGIKGYEDHGDAIGVLWRWQDGAFEELFGARDMPTIGGLRAIDGSARDDIWVAGRGAGLWRFDGIDWSPITALQVEGEPIDVNLATVVSVGPGAAMAGGAPDLHPGTTPYTGLIVHADATGARVFRTDANEPIQKLWVAGGRGVAFDTRPRAWLLEGDGTWSPAEIDDAEGIAGPIAGSLWGDGARLWVTGFDGHVWRSPAIEDVYQSLRDGFDFAVR